MKLGRFADQDPVAESEATARLEEERLATEAIAVGSRCEITGAGGMPKRGVVMFTGEKRITGTFCWVLFSLFSLPRDPKQKFNPRKSI